MLVKTQIIAIAVVAVVVAASAGVALIVLNDDKGFKIDQNLSAGLEVFGNANNDNVIDQADIDLIREIIAGEKSAKDYPLADANCDGVVNQKDIDLVNAIINADSENRVRINIVNHYDMGLVLERDVLYPITAAISPSATNTVLVLKYLGIVEELKGVSKGSSLDAFLFSEYEGIRSADKDLGPSSMALSVEPVSEIVDKENVTAIIAEHNTGYVSNQSQFEDMGLSVIRVRASSIDIDEYLSALLMVAFLFDTDGKGYMDKCTELIQWIDEFYKDLNSKLSTLTEKVLTIASSMDGYVSSGTSDNTKLIQMAGAEFALYNVDFGGNSTATYKNSEGDKWLDGYDIDVVIILRGSSAGVYSWYEGTAISQGSDTLISYINNFSTLKCYREGSNVYVVCSELPLPIRIAYIAQILYPELFGEDFAYSYHLDFVMKFFGWDEDTINGKTFSISMTELGL